MKIGIENINVELISWPLQELAQLTMYRMSRATFKNRFDADEGIVDITDLIIGENLGTALESLQLTFAISGVSRTTTHQLVRQRIGVGFNQESFRDHDISENEIICPETIAKDKYLYREFEETMKRIKELYRVAIETGIPYQDARFMMPMGTSTYIVSTTNFRALQGLIAQRLCNTVQWEINYVSRLMVAEIKKKLPIFGDWLKCSCEKTGKCTAYGSTLFPPCGFKPASEELLRKKYSMPDNNMNGCLEFIKKDIELGRKWIPNE